MPDRNRFPISKSVACRDGRIQIVQRDADKTFIYTTGFCCNSEIELDAKARAELVSELLSLDHDLAEIELAQQAEAPAPEPAIKTADAPTKPARKKKATGGR